MRDLQLYASTPKQLEIKPKKVILESKPLITKEQKYFQKKKKLEEKVSSHPKKSDLNICYLCLVYFTKEPDIIKSHLQGKRHQKN